MKNLANCTPLEFLRQTNRIRKAAANWLTLTKVMALRKRAPAAGDDPEAVRRQIEQNARDILGAVLEEYPRETAELLCLMCFIEPEEMDDHPMRELLGGLSEMLSCREVVDFFISLARLARTPTSGGASRSGSTC